MKIKVNKQDIIYDIKSKSHLEVANIAEPEARYRAEVGTEKMDEIMIDIQLADARVRETVSEYLVDPSPADTYDTEHLIYNFSLAPRRAKNALPALEREIKSYIVEATLALYYIAVDQVTLAEKHQALANSVSTLIQSIIYTKAAPTIRK